MRCNGYGDFENIGHAYAYVKQIEAYGIGGHPVARVGLWRSFDASYDEGLGRMSLESHINFDIANLSEDLTPFDVIVVPGMPCLSSTDAERLNAYAQHGGHLLVMAGGALNLERDTVHIDIGARYLGEGEYDVDYLVGDNIIGSGLVPVRFSTNHQLFVSTQDRGHPKILATIGSPTSVEPTENSPLTKIHLIDWKMRPILASSAKAM